MNNNLDSIFNSDNTGINLVNSTINNSSTQLDNLIDESTISSSASSSISSIEVSNLIDNQLEENNQINLNSFANTSIFPNDLSVEIVNGDFSISDSTSDDFGWNITGSAYVDSGQGLLTEDSAFLSSINQTFEVTEDTKSLQLTLVDIDLGDSFFAPDALEIALLDADNFTPLAGIHSLGETDALFNLQNDGTANFSDNVRLSSTTSGDSINLENSHTVSVDISHLPAGTEATLRLWCSRLPHPHR